MMTEALTLFTKGRAEFYLDGVKRGDRVPGILSSEYEPVGQGGEFRLEYVVPTTRVCIPKNINRDQLPIVKKHLLEAGVPQTFKAGSKLLVCLGQVSINHHKLFKEEQSVQLIGDATIEADRPTILLEFLS